MIRLTNVTKRFYATVALDSISLDIPGGEVMGLLGPNGAGKTTMLRLIAGFIFPDAGRVQPPANGWPAIGYKPERLLFPNNLRVSQYLNIVAGLANIAGGETETEVFASLARVNLLNAANSKINTLTKGMRQRLGLAQALIGDPPLLLLDEPSSGLDPEGQLEIHNYIQKLHRDGKTIVLCSHQLPEVTKVCTELVILNRGEIHYHNRVAEALSLKLETIIESDRDLEPYADVLTSLHPQIEVNDNLILLQNEAMSMKRQILSLLLNLDLDIVRLEQKRVTLDEIYSEAVQ